MLVMVLRRMPSLPPVDIVGSSLAGDRTRKIIPLGTLTLHFL